MPDPLAPLSAAYIKAWEAIQREQLAIAGESSAFRRRRRLRELERSVAQILDKLDAYSREFIRSQMPQVFVAGSREAAAFMGVPSGFAQIDQRTVQRFSEDLFDDLLRATTYVREDTKRFIRKALKDRLISREILGESPAKVRREMVRYLQENGIRGIRYANGRHVGLDDYADMAIRTKSSIARNLSGVTFSKANGVEYFTCLDGTGCGLYGHAVGPVANGYVGTAEEALAYPLSHPRCVRVWLPIAGARTKSEAEANKIMPTDEQMADQLAAEEIRRQQQTRRRQAARRRETLLARRERRLSA